MWDDLTAEVAELFAEHQAGQRYEVVVALAGRLSRRRELKTASERCRLGRGETVPCLWCGELLQRRTGRGGQPRFCSAEHRQAQHRKQAREEWRRNGVGRKRRARQQS